MASQATTTTGPFIRGIALTGTQQLTLRTALGLGSLSTQASNLVAITGGTIDGVAIGSSVTGTGQFTSIKSGGGTSGGFFSDNSTVNLGSSQALGFSSSSANVAAAPDITLRKAATGDFRIALSGTDRFQLTPTGLNGTPVGQTTAAPGSFTSIAASSTITAAASLLITGGSLQFGALSDAILAWDAANILAMRNGVNAQAFRVYRTFTDVSNFELASIAWSGTTLNIGTANAGTGVARGITLRTAATDRITINGVNGDTAITSTTVGSIGGGALTIPSGGMYASGAIYTSSQFVAASAGYFSIQGSFQIRSGGAGIVTLRDATNANPASLAALSGNFTGGLSAATVSKSSAYTATAADYTILVDTSAAGWTLLLPPAASSAGKILNIKKVSTDSNSITIDGNASETIDGQTSLSFGSPMVAVTIQCNGTAWFVINITSP